MNGNNQFDFDEVIDRRNTDSGKWGFLEERYGDRDVIPLPVADMDFRAAPEILEAIMKRTEHGIFGYTHLTEAYRAAVVGWFQRRHHWEIEPRWIVTSPGVVSAIFAIQKAFSHTGDKVIVQAPIYHPFLMGPTIGREVLINPLIYRDGYYEMDFDDLEQKTKDPRARIMILCSPHNPGCRVWKEEELTRVAEICIANDILLVSDEIHCDLILPGHRHIALASLSKDIAAKIIVCTAASKTFNLAGLHTSNIIIPNRRLRREFRIEMGRMAYGSPNVFGMTATQAAYEKGDTWLDALMDYINSNYEYLKSFFKQNLPKAAVVDLEGTYLVWADFRKYGFGPDELAEILEKKAKVALNHGYIFGPGGEGFERINIACPRSILEEALRRMAQALNS